jgi:hypothetical protein
LGEEVGERSSYWKIGSIHWSIVVAGGDGVADGDDDWSMLRPQKVRASLLYYG